ncbi:MAG: type II toxin-antitoxin system PemK/MazF family toxin [Methanothrix sp.]|nr:type II toxin-antitoxin system PemK/MazF family toxin [Methanothrix sp.]
MNGDTIGKVRSPPVDARGIAKGDIIFVDFRFVRALIDIEGRIKETSKERPALAIYTERRQLVVAYITSKLLLVPDPADVSILKSNPSFEKTGLKNSSIIKLGVLYTVSRDDVLGWLGSLDDALRNEINTKLAACFRI